MSIMNNIKKGIDTTLSGTHNHYLSFLPGNIGIIPSFILKLLFSGIKVNSEQEAIINNLQKDGIVIYTTKYRSYLKYLFFHTHCKKAGLPCPEIGFGYRPFMFQPALRLFKICLAHIDHFLRYFSFPNPYDTDYYKEELLNGKSGLLSLIEKKGFYLRFVKKKTDPVQYIIDIQKSIDRPIYIIPQLMFFSKKPVRSTPTVTDIIFGTEENPGRLRRIFTLINNPKKVFVEVSDPFNIQQFLAQPEIRDLNPQQQTLKLRRSLIRQINSHRQSITGPVQKSREEIKLNILTGPKIQRFMKNHAQKKNIPLKEVHKKANDYLEEIAANISLNWIRMYDIVLTWILGHIFEGMIIDYNGLNKLKAMSKKGPLILIPCHKSHLDYLILSYIFFHNNLACPLIAAGKNLSFWPLGTIFKGGGAFFLRRTFRGAILYSKIFNAYVFKILKEGFNIELFIEGGRSRTGKVLMPKLGFLSMLLNAYREGACEDMIFVGINIGYDRILEERAYIHEIEGGQKEPENVKQVIEARKFLKKRYGKVYVNFHEPFSLQSLLLQRGKGINDLTSKEMNTLCRYIGYRLINDINSETVVTPYGLVASSLLNFSKKRFTYEHFLFHFNTYLTHLNAQNSKLSDTLIGGTRYSINQVLDNFRQRKFIEFNVAKAEELNSNKIIKLIENKRPDLEYYKNNSIFFFVPAAITSLSILEKDAFLFSASDIHVSFKFISNLFVNEFALDADKPSEYFVRKSIKAFIDDAIIIPHQSLPDTYNLTSTGFRKIKLFASFLKTFLESYLVVITYYKQNSDIPKDQKVRIKKIQLLGNSMYKKREVERIESLSKISYMNADSFFVAQKLNHPDNVELIDFFKDSIKINLQLLS